jgi:hypothetical protein
LLPRAEVPPAFFAEVALYAWATKAPYACVVGRRSGRVHVLPLKPTTEREQEQWDEAAAREERAALTAQTKRPQG